MEKNLSFLRIVLITLCGIFLFSYTQAQTYNFILSGDMENLNWTGVPGKTNLTTTFDASSGINGTTSYKLFLKIPGIKYIL
ncbi:hypothetical protein [Dysgonomonas reticulitermitis]